MALARRMATLDYIIERAKTAVEKSDGIRGRPREWPAPSPGEDDAEVWIPPSTDCMNHAHDPCPHCDSRIFHHRTGRCGTCGRRPARAHEDGGGPDL